MVSTFNIALSGLKAASTSLETGARNVANARSTHVIVDGNKIDKPYTPQKVVQSSLATGGVVAKNVDVTPATVKLFDPNSDNADENDVAEYPNVDLEGEAVNQIVSTYTFKANLKVIKAQADLEKNILDIKT